MANELPQCRSVRRNGDWCKAHGSVALTYDARFLRRKRLVPDEGGAFLVDLPEVASLKDGDAFALDDGRLIAVKAAEERILAVEGDLPRLAWHIGNRHTPCQIEHERLFIRHDHVLLDMLVRLGARVTELTGPFSPEGGAYGHGRTLGHDHGHDQHRSHDA